MVKSLLDRSSQPLISPTDTSGANDVAPAQTEAPEANANQVTSPEVTGPQTPATPQTTGAATPIQPSPDTQPTQPQSVTPAIATPAAETTPPPPQSQTQAKTPAYLADWQNNTFGDVVKNSDKSIAELISDRNRWAQDTKGNPLDVYEIMSAIQGKDISKSAKQNADEEKAAARKARWDQVSNLLLQLGNFMGTIGGAPGYKYEDPNELTKRQQALRDAVLKQRETANTNYLAQIWKQQADQRAKELNAANIILLGARKANTDNDTANDNKTTEATIALKGAQQKAVEDKNTRENNLQPFKTKVLSSQANANEARAQKSRSGGSSGSGSGRGAGKYTAYDSAGRIHYFTTQGEAQTFAKREGTWVEKITTSDMDNKGNTVQRSSGGYAGKPGQSKAKSSNESFDVNRYRRGGAKKPPLN